MLCTRGGIFGRETVQRGWLTPPQQCKRMSHHSQSHRETLTLFRLASIAGCRPIFTMHQLFSPNTPHSIFRIRTTKFEATQRISFNKCACKLQLTSNTIAYSRTPPIVMGCSWWLRGKSVTFINKPTPPPYSPSLNYVIGRLFVMVIIDDEQWAKYERVRFFLCPPLGMAAVSAAASVNRVILAAVCIGSLNPIDSATMHSGACGVRIWR